MYLFQGECVHVYCTFVYVYTLLHTRVCVVCVFMYVCLSACMCAFSCVCVFVCVCMCVRIHVCVCMYSYVYTSVFYSVCANLTTFLSTHSFNDSLAINACLPLH